jgi:hypothetical protein
MTLYANVNYDRAIWMAIPLYWGPEAWETPEAWGREMAQTWWTGFKHRRKDVDRLAETLTRLAHNYGFRDPNGPEIIAYLYLPNPGLGPMMVKVCLDYAPGITLEALANADDPHVLEPPIVHHFTTPHLGTGFRSTRYYEADLSGTGASGSMTVYGMLHYGFLLPEEDGAFLVARCLEPDLRRFAQAMDDIDAFVREIRCADEPLTYANGEIVRWSPGQR